MLSVSVCSSAAYSLKFLFSRYIESRNVLSVAFHYLPLDYEFRDNISSNKMTEKFKNLHLDSWK